MKRQLGDLTPAQAYERGYEDCESSQLADWVSAFSERLGIEVTGPMDAVEKLRAILRVER